MSKFKKILIILTCFLVFEIIIMCINFKNTYTQAFSNNHRNIVIIVDVSSNYMYVFENDKVIKKYAVAGGKPSTPSPIGIWKVIGKDTWGEGFGGRWMGLNVPWGKYGIHGTIFPNSIGWNSSHGCIRMRNKNVKELYNLVHYGTPVIIIGGPYGNFGNGLRAIRPGMRGSDVYEIQRIMKDKGYYDGNPDGIYGEGMKYYIHKFQKENSLSQGNVISTSFYKKLGIKLVE